jgi:hypothetical protein
MRRCGEEGGKNGRKICVNIRRCKETGGIEKKSV